MPETPDVAPVPARLPYEPPSFEVDGVFETLALGCHTTTACSGASKKNPDPAGKCCNISWS